jgi:pilus assembly protein Flp/PilA
MASIATLSRQLRLDTRSMVGRFAACQSGATAVEYGIMAMIFSVTVIGASGSIKSAIQSAFSTVSTALVATNSGS